MSRSARLVVLSVSLAGWLASLTAWGAPQPAVRVAVFDDPAYVDTASAPPNAESDNVQASLVSLGFTVTTFVGTADVAWRAAASTADVLLVPELSVAGDLATDLDENAEQAIVDFVGAGGVLIVQSNNADTTAFVNAVFDFATATGASAVAGLAPLAASGTRFVQGPDSLPQNNATNSIGGLPPGARSLYVTGVGAVTLASIPYGAGKIICMGWDWFDAAPIGGLDGGWNEALRRAVLEGRPPTRRVAVLDDPAFVDTIGGFTAESDTMQAALVAQDMLVTTIGAVNEPAVAAALGNPFRPAADVLVVPEQQNGEIAPTLNAPTLGRIRDFVGRGGVLVVAGGFQGARAASLLNTVFGFATAAGPLIGGNSALTDTAGTVFAGAPATLTSPSDTATLLALPAGSQALYNESGNAAVALIPYREGRIFYVGWDYFNAVPLGTVDDGWLTVLDRAARTSPPARRVAVFNDETYVDATEETAFPGFAIAEGVNMRASLRARGHIPRPFTGVTEAAWAAALAEAEALVVPDQEVGDLTPALATPVRSLISSFVRRGGLMVVPVGQNARGLTLVNALFGTTLAQGALAGPYSADPDRLGTPFETGLPSLLENNATNSVLISADLGRTAYGTPTDSVVTWLQFGAGHVLILSWDWFDAASAGGNLDGGWEEILDLAVQSARARTRRVAVFDNPTYVDTGGLVTSESDNVQASLAFLDHPVRTFSGTDVGTLREAIGNSDVLLIPEQEASPLGPALPADTRHELRAFVAAGGALVVHGSFNTPSLLNTVFGWALAQPAGGPTPILLDAVQAIGTRFAGAPGSVAENNGTYRLSNLPFGGRSIYNDSGAPSGSVISWIPYGLGRVVVPGWDFFDAAPVGTQDAGWLGALDRAVQEARPRTRRVGTGNGAAWVDTSIGGESDNLMRALEAVGEQPNTAYYFPLTQAMAIPELEVGPFTGNEQELRDYVARGGLLILSLDSLGNAATLLNSAFGLSVFITVPVASTFVRAAGASGTPFAGGPATLPYLSAVRALGGAPASARRIYDDGAGGDLVVATLPYGAGQIAVLGWDFFGQRPYGPTEAGQSGWFEVLRRSLDVAPPAARRVAVFDDPGFVDTTGGPGAESDAVQASLLMLEHAVVPFTGTAQGDFANALSRADVLLVPELNNNLAGVITPGTAGEVRTFVNGGGGLVVHGGNGNAANFINFLYSTALSEDLGANPTLVHGGLSTLGTQFESSGFVPPPPTLANNSFVYGLADGTEPASLRRAYVGTTNLKTVVGVLPRGYGRLTYLGWDWFNAVPLGANDGGWNDVLDRAVREGMGGDADDDGVATAQDLCPMFGSSSQADGDLDGVGDVCDSCTTMANPRVQNGDWDFVLSGNQWVTLTGGQRDDDHDGYGNRCDGKFPGISGLFVGGGDLTEFRASNTKNRANDVCGTIGTRPCAIFDLDETGTFIGGGDLTQWRMLNTKAPGPRCATCPQPCFAGGSGTCN